MEILEQYVLLWWSVYAYMCLDDTASAGKQRDLAEIVSSIGSGSDPGCNNCVQVRF